jgi:predicted neuraminidase
MHQMRAAYDAYARERLLYESRLESDALDALETAPRVGAAAAMAAATRVLDRAVSGPCCRALRARIDALCDALFRDIRMQSSVARHGASGAERGAVLDFVDHPLNNRWWLEDRFSEIGGLADQDARLARLRGLVAWTRPGAGSFYDDVGNVADSPRVVRRAAAGSVNETLPHFTWEGGPTRTRLSTLTSLRWPAAIDYTGLDASARYVVRLLVVRPGKTPQVRLRIDGETVAPRSTPAANGALEFEVPAALVKDGHVVLTFDEIDESDVNWRQHSRLTDAWLIREDTPRVERVFGPEIATGPYKHPACLTELANGDLYLVYFGGQGEYANDTAVFGARRAKGSASWSTPAAIARDAKHPLGNAVVWQAPDGVVWLFYVVRYGATWSTSRIEARVSRDGAATWSEPIKLHDAEGMMVRNRPIVLSDGDYLLPVYLERGDDTETVGAASTSLFLRYQRSTGTWRQTGAITSPRGVIQPAVAEIAPGHLVAYNRRGGGYGPTTDGWMIRAESRDGGWTWTPGRDTAFPNPNAAVEFVKLKSGSLLLVYNDTMAGRTPLVAALSTDGDLTYPHRRRIAEGPGDFAYPIALQSSDGAIHVVFTSDGRRVVNHAVFSEAWLLGR